MHEIFVNLICMNWTLVYCIQTSWSQGCWFLDLAKLHGIYITFVYFEHTSWSQYCLILYLTDLVCAETECGNGQCIERSNGNQSCCCLDSYFGSTCQFIGKYIHTIQPVLSLKTNNIETNLCVQNRQMLYKYHAI
jgi:hypothetical protein